MACKVENLIDVVGHCDRVQIWSYDNYIIFDNGIEMLDKSSVKSKYGNLYIHRIHFGYNKYTKDETFTIILDNSIDKLKHLI